MLTRRWLRRSIRVVAGFGATAPIAPVPGTPGGAVAGVMARLAARREG